MIGRIYAQKPSRFGDVARALVVLTCCLVAGCSHQSRYGRDRSELKHKTVPKDETAIRLAKSAAMSEESTNNDDDVSAVSVLFVNGTPITVNDVLKWVRSDLSEMSRKLPPREYQQKMLEILTRQVRSEAESTLLEQVARRRLQAEQIEKIEPFVDARVREVINKNHGGRQARYEEWLRKRGVSMLEDRQRIRRDLLIIAHLQRSVGHKVAEPTRREVEQFYKEYRAELKTGNRRRMQLIDIPFGRVDALGNRLVPAVRKSDAREQIESAQRRVKGGENFSVVANDLSRGINSSKGGDWGWVSRDGTRERWKPAIETVYAVPVGGVSSVIETESAFFLVKCTDAERSEPQSFVEIQKELIGKYKNRQFDVLTRELVAKHYSEADIKPLNPGRFLRAVVEAAPKPAGFSS
ncbi:MAG: hypothetical protein GXP29_12525 [Planctomycetes bacterium]|nr:hypothetical protein [Planctomycetota bacterium]